MKRFFPLLVVLLLAVFLFHRGVHWNELQTVLQQAQWSWLLLAVAFQAASYAAVTWLNEILLRHYGATVPFTRQYVIQLAMAFIESVVPSATISGTVLRARLLKSDGVAPDVATVTTLVEMALVTASVVLLALPVAGLTILQSIQGINLSHQTVILWIMAGVALGLLVIWQWRQRGFIRIRRWGVKRVSLFWDELVLPRWHRQFGNWPSKRIRQRGRNLAAKVLPLLREQPYAIGISLLGRAGFEVLGLGMCFLALGQTLPWTSLLVVYALTLATNALGAIPGAVGLAELSLTALYTRLGISPETALAIALSYRLTDYWLPRVFGGVAWLWLEREFPRRIQEGGRCPAGSD